MYVVYDALRLFPLSSTVIELCGVHIRVPETGDDDVLKLLLESSKYLSDFRFIHYVFVSTEKMVFRI